MISPTVTKPADVNKNIRDTTREADTALGDLKNIEASQDAAQRYQKADVLSEVGSAAGSLAQKGGYEGRKGLSRMFREVAPKAGELLVKQASEQDKLNFQGAQQEEGRLLLKQKAALDKYNQETKEKEKDLALITMRQAFDAGYDTKQMIYSNNAALADLAFQQLQEDYNNGRVSNKEIQSIMNSSKAEMARYQQTAERAMTEIQGLFNKGLTDLNANEAKRLMREYLEAQKQIQLEAAKAANAAMVTRGTTDFLGEVASWFVPEKASGLVQSGVTAGANFIKNLF